MKAQAVATGTAMAFLWMVKRHLWLSQSQFQGEDRACLLRPPVVPSAMFGQDANKMLQEAQDARWCAREMSGMLQQGHGKQISKAPETGPPQQASGASWDPRFRLEENRRGRAKCGQWSGQG